VSVAGSLVALGYGAAGQPPTYLAHHALVLALPFVLPVLLVVAMVAVVAWRDRHRPDEPAEPDGRDDRDDLRTRGSTR
jgi:membrane protein DedA with SNARE-associated domain